MRPPFNTGEFGPGIGGRRGGPRGGGPRPDRGPGRGPGRGPAEVPDASDAAGWFAGRLPDDWFVGAPEVVVDRDEITIVGELPALPDGATDAAAEPPPRSAGSRGSARTPASTASTSLGRPSTATSAVSPGEPASAAPSRCSPSCRCR